MLKAVLFDLDGVLIDSELLSQESSDRVLARVGINRTAREKEMAFGMRTIDYFRMIAKIYGVVFDAEKLAAEKDKVLAGLIKGRLKPLPGVMSLLKGLKLNGVRVAVVSSSPLGRVNDSLEETGLILDFDVVVSGDCCSKGKPAPEPFLLAAEKLDVRPGECVVVEDAEIGISSAKDAGMKVIAVKSPNTRGQDLGKADAVVKSLEKVDLKFLKHLNDVLK